MSENWISRYLRERAHKEAPHPGAMNPDLINAASDVDDMMAALEPLSAWAEMERRKHRAAGEDNEAEYMGLLADAARAAIAKARGE